MADDPERLALERLIIDDPDDAGAWAVYADYLQLRGDPWGERLSLGLAQRNQDDQLRAALRAHDERMAPVLLGEALAALLTTPGFAAVVNLERRHGLVIGARIGRGWVAGTAEENQVDHRHATQVLPALLTGSAARLLGSLTLGYCDLEQARTALQAAGPREPLRRFALGWEQRNAHGGVEALAELGDLGELLALMPALRELALTGAAEELDHPGIETLALEAGGARQSEALREPLRRAALPSLQTLELRLQAVGSSGSRTSHRRGRQPPPGLAELLAAVDRNPSATGLRALRIVASRHPRLVLELLRAAPLLSRLRVLDLSGCRLEDSDLEPLLADVGAFAGLERLELPAFASRGQQQLRALRRQLPGVVSLAES